MGRQPAAALLHNLKKSLINCKGGHKVTLGKGSDGAGACTPTLQIIQNLEGMALIAQVGEPNDKTRHSSPRQYRIFLPQQKKRKR